MRRFLIILPVRGGATASKHTFGITNKTLPLRILKGFMYNFETSLVLRELKFVAVT